MPLPTSPLIRSFQWDLARQVERLDWLIAQFPRYADWGYDEVHVHLEDAVDYPSLPGVARRDAYSYRQFGRLVDAATRAGIKVVPIVNLLGHTQYLIKVPALRDLNELRADNGAPLERGQLCPVHPQTLEVAEKLLHDMAPFCTAGKVHVGLDESFHLGKHPRSQKEIAAIGLGAHFANYVRRLQELTDARGLRMGMWADMLYFLPEAIPLLPENITAYEWYYHGFQRHPRVELFNFAEVDIATPLRRRGIARYGCPMNGAFRFEPLPIFGDRLNNLTRWWRHALDTGATGFLVSSWEPYRLAVEITTVIDAAAATLWLEPEISDPREMLKRGFQRAFGKRGDEAAALALACDRYPFSGYARWEINQSWQTISRRESLRKYQQEAKFFLQLTAAAKQKKLPAPLRASIEFRSYLAQRDVGARQLAAIHDRGGDAQPALRKLLIANRAGLRAARTMWRRTRARGVSGPNEQIVQADRGRIAAVRCGRDVFGGAWQLCYAVWNFAPAAQLVGIEQQQTDGSWKVLQSSHTIEFRSVAARRQSNIVREHAAPVEWDGDLRDVPSLRVFLRGVGEVKVGRFELRGPRKKLYRLGKKNAGHWLRLGQKPQFGWPVFLRDDDCVRVLTFGATLKSRPSRAAQIT